MQYEESNLKCGLQESGSCHHDFGAAHTAFSIGEFLAKHSIPALSQLPY
jgi:hypothetical protein